MTYFRQAHPPSVVGSQRSYQRSYNKLMAEAQELKKGEDYGNASISYLEAATVAQKLGAEVGRYSALREGLECRIAFAQIAARTSEPSFIDSKGIEVRTTREGLLRYALRNYLEEAKRLGLGEELLRVAGEELFEVAKDAMRRNLGKLGIEDIALVAEVLGLSRPLIYPRRE
jgi:hypothetical protein